MTAHLGVFVAFDRFGADYGYAWHPDSHTHMDRETEQWQKIELLKKEAIECGGWVIHLSLEEFEALILTNAKLDDIDIPSQMIAI